MLEEVLQSGKTAIGDFLREFPDSTGQKLADNIGGVYGRIGTFAEMSEDSINRSKRICESTFASLHDTDLSILGIEVDRKDENALGSSSKQCGASGIVVNADKGSVSFPVNRHIKVERNKMGEKKTNTKSLCRPLPVVKEDDLDEITRESVKRIRGANEAAGELINFVDQIASHIEFSSQLDRIHSQVNSGIHKLEMAVASVFRGMNNEIVNPDELARAASKFDKHLDDVSRIVSNLGKITDKTSELRSLAVAENEGISAFYSQGGSIQDRKLVAKSSVAKSFKKHNELIVGRINDYLAKTKGKLAQVAQACHAWREVQGVMRERNEAIESAISAFRSAPCRMPNICDESIPGNGYSFKVRDIHELQKIVRDSAQGIVSQLSRRIDLMWDAQPKLDRFESKHVNRSSLFPAFILLNETQYKSRDNSQLKVDITVPHVHLFPFANPMSIPNKDIAQILLLRLATALPLGCCDITVLDHEAQGGSVLGIAPMRDVPGLMNLVVRRDQMAEAIKELYEYSGKLVQDGYFTTEEPDWITYNAKHPEAPLPYKVLAVFSLAGIERITDGKSMLQSLMKNGRDRGIHVVFAGEAHNQVCGDDKAYELDRRNVFSKMTIDVLQS